MVDAFGNTLEIGDHVAAADTYGTHKILRDYIVIGETPKKIKILNANYLKEYLEDSLDIKPWWISYRDSKMLCKIAGKEKEEEV